MKNLLTILFFIFAASIVNAQNYSVDWFKIAGGGGLSSGGAYSLSGTVGQPDAGTLTGGNYTLAGGFWSIITAIQEPGAPLLTVTRSNNFSVISWPSSSTGFVLQENTNLGTTNWITSAQTTSTNNGQVSVVAPATVGYKFFRLKK